MYLATANEGQPNNQQQQLKRTYKKSPFLFFIYLTSFLYSFYLVGRVEGTRLFAGYVKCVLSFSSLTVEERGFRMGCFFYPSHLSLRFPLLPVFYVWSLLEVVFVDKGRCSQCLTCTKQITTGGGTVTTGTPSKHQG